MTICYQDVGDEADSFKLARDASPLQQLLHQKPNRLNPAFCGCCYCCFKNKQSESEGPFFFLQCVLQRTAWKITPFEESQLIWSHCHILTRLFRNRFAGHLELQGA